MLRNPAPSAMPQDRRRTAGRSRMAGETSGLLMLPEFPEVSW